MKHTSTKKHTILVLGSGALKIGEAGEFDYSGSQAIKVFKSYGHRVILVNPNIATVQTGEGLADAVYFSPVTPEVVTRIIVQEKPTHIALSFGGQTALNCGLELDRTGVLKKYKVTVLGTPVSVIDDTEDRKRFVKRLKEIDVHTPRSIAATTLVQAHKAAEKIGFPLMVRSGFALGGLGSGIVKNKKAFTALVTRALAHAPQVLVEESLYGWKEIEYEVVRDSAGNTVTVCNMENIDPLGVHTGESIVVAPSQTLTNDEYHHLREVSIKTISHLGIVGECNIQFALHPTTAEYRVIEVNARLSRSSALASKATGYPLAAVAAHIVLGNTLPDIQNPVTKITKACFEPALDYVAVKVPRWDTKKFKHADTRIGSQMKSVGEVMGLGRSFEEALQKAWRMSGACDDGLWNPHKGPAQTLRDRIALPSEDRLCAVAEGFSRGMTVNQVHTLSHITPWFLHRIAHIVQLGKRMHTVRSVARIDTTVLRQAKQAGYADVHIARLVLRKKHVSWQEVEQVRTLRKKHGIVPVVKQIDTLAGEFPARTNYLYLTYHGTVSDVPRLSQKPIIVLGSGVYRIGQSVEFDWCSVEALRTLRAKGKRAVVINFNPETVSTDYDESDRLYFEELSQERVRDIVDIERPQGVIVSMGGQTANNLVVPLSRAKVPMLGTTADSIDRAENRHRFSSMLDTLDIDQPRWAECSSEKAARAFAKKVGYPVLIRPSYVLSGAAMRVIHDEAVLKETLRLATEVSPEYPVVISEYITRAKELEFDGVAVRGEIKAWAIAEHIEHAGVHSGDATLVYPPQHVYRETIFRMQRLAAKIVDVLKITGPFNIQFLAKDNWLKIIECNVRASRSFPFVSKIGRQNLAQLATRALLGDTLAHEKPSTLDYKYVGVKAPQFSFTRLPGADPVSGVEMASTGEVGCIGTSVHDAFLQAQYATGFRIKKKSVLVSIGGERNRFDLLDSIETLRTLGFDIYATEHTSEFLRRYKVAHTRVAKLSEKKHPNVGDFLHNGGFGMMLVVQNENKPMTSHDHYEIRRSAVDRGIPLFTNAQVFKVLVGALVSEKSNGISVVPWHEWR
jgi:carbamoyl-phosphate synthase large subunit